MVDGTRAWFKFSSFKRLKRRRRRTLHACHVVKGQRSWLKLVHCPQWLLVLFIYLLVSFKLTPVLSSSHRGRDEEKRKQRISHRNTAFSSRSCCCFLLVICLVKRVTAVPQLGFRCFCTTQVFPQSLPLLFFFFSASGRCVLEDPSLVYRPTLTTSDQSGSGSDQSARECPSTPASLSVSLYVTNQTSGQSEADESGTETFFFRLK